MKSGIITIIALLLLAGCGITGEVSAPEKIKIGVSLPMTGPAAPTAQWVMNGINLALEHLPAEERSRIELVVENDEGKSATAITVAQKFVNANIKFVIGPLSSVTTVPTVQFYDDNKVLRMHPGAGVESTISNGTYRFFLLGKVEPWMKALAEYAGNISTVSILYMDDEYGRDNLKWFEKYYSGKILVKESFARGDSDFRTQLLKIKDSNPDAVFLIAIGPSFLSALKQMAELGIDKPRLSLINTEDSEIVKSASQLIEGVVYPTITDSSSSEIRSWFSQRYFEKFGVPNEPVAASAFDSFNILWSAIQVCGEDVDCVKAEVAQTGGYTGASGIISVDAQGVGVRIPAIKTVRNGKFVYLT